VAILEFHDVYLSLGGRGIITGANLKIEPSEFVVLLGENGAGKSTLLRLSNGLLKPDSGSVTVCGYDTRITKTSLIARQVGFLFQNPDRQIFNKTIRKEIEFGLKLFGMATRESYSEYKIPDWALEDNPYTLSRGERQRVALASVLVTEPSLCLLDEPTVGLDANESDIIMRAIADHREKKGAAILMITHDIDIAQKYADRMILLKGGKISDADLSAGEWFTP